MSKTKKNQRGQQTMGQQTASITTGEETGQGDNLELNAGSLEQTGELNQQSEDTGTPEVPVVKLSIDDLFAAVRAAVGDEAVDANVDVLSDAFSGIPIENYVADSKEADEVKEVAINFFKDFLVNQAQEAANKKLADEQAAKTKAAAQQAEEIPQVARFKTAALLATHGVAVNQGIMHNVHIGQSNALLSALQIKDDAVAVKAANQIFYFMKENIDKQFSRRDIMRFFNSVPGVDKTVLSQYEVILTTAATMLRGDMPFKRETMINHIASRLAGIDASTSARYTQIIDVALQRVGA